MVIEKGDYVILRGTRKKHLLARVIKLDVPNRAVLVGKDEASKATKQYVRFEDGDVIVNLGQHPTNGKAYGLDVDIFYKHEAIEPWGDVFYFRQLARDDEKKLIKELDYVGGQLTKQKIFPTKTMEIHIRSAKGKFAGMYKHFGNADKTDILTVRFPEFSESRYYIAHECAHGIWYSRLDEYDHAQWIKIHNRNVVLSSITPKLLDATRLDLLKAGKVVDYYSQLSDDERDVFKEIRLYIKQKHSLLPKHLNSLIEQDDDLITYWPKYVDISKKKIFVSEYGMKSPEELWADSFGYTTAGKQIPKSATALLDSTIARAKG